jgi:glutaminase
MVFPNSSQAEKFERVCQIWSELCLETIGFANGVFLGERDTADKNFCLAYMMRESKCLPPDYDIEKLVSLYLSFCSLETNCRALSVAAATLANGGLNPFTGNRIFQEKTVRNCLSLMASCGMYDGSGAFQLRMGIPAKSGVSGM